MLRASGIVAALAIYPTLRWPGAAELVSFALVTMFVNGPLAPFLPATYEPILMTMGRLYPALLVATVGIAATLFIEYMNYHLYRAALLHPRLDAFREKPLLVRVVALFNRKPFFAVWLCSWSPLPYWAVRVLAPLSNYPVRPYLVATFLGRFPRLWFFAALGMVVPVPTQYLIMFAATISAVGIIVAVHRRSRARVTSPPSSPRSAYRANP